MITDLGLTDENGDPLKWEPLFKEPIDQRAYRDWYVAETQDEFARLTRLAQECNPPRWT